MAQLAPDPSLVSKCCDAKRLRAQRTCEPNTKRLELLTTTIDNDIENKARTWPL